MMQLNDIKIKPKLVGLLEKKHDKSILLHPWGRQLIPDTSGA